MSEVLTIVGRGDTWDICPFEGEIWAASSVLVTPEMKDRHYDKVFAFDFIDTVPALKEYIAAAKERNIPLVSVREYATEEYPIVEIINEFRTTFLKNTVSYMIALAIYKGYKDIRMYGVDQDQDIQYVLAKPYVVFWLGVAVGRGVKYTIANNTFPQYMNEGMQKVADRINIPPMKREDGVLCIKP